MARIRTIKPEFWEDEKIASLPISCRLFFIGTWNLADDNGVFRANPAILRSKLFPYDENLRIGEIQRWLDALIKVRMIIPVIHNEESYYVIRTFRRHQKIDKRYGRPLIDEKAVDEILSDYQNGITQAAQRGNTVSPALEQRGHAVGKGKEEELESKEKETGEESGKYVFELFWNSYHRITGLPKTDREAALKHWDRLTERERRKATDSIELYFKSLSNAKYCKKARTYLADKNFNDEFKTAGVTGFNLAQ